MYAPKTEKNKRIDSWHWIINIETSQGTVGSPEIHKTFESGGYFTATLPSSLTFPYPEDTKRKIPGLEKMRREKEGEAKLFTTSLLNMIHYLIRRKERSTCTYNYAEKYFVTFYITEGPCAGVWSGYLVCAAQYKSENGESLVQKVGKKSMIKILNSKTYFLCKLSALW